MTQSDLPSGKDRRHEADTRRTAAVKSSFDLPLLRPVDNGDEDRFPDGQPASFTKGLNHDAFGLVSRGEYENFREALVIGDERMKQLKIAAPEPHRKWESPIAGVYFNDIGADTDAVAMPPAPKLGLSELCAEMASVYAMAITRDMSFESLQDPNAVIPNIHTGGNPVTVQDLVDALRKLSWFATDGKPVGWKGKSLTGHEKRRRAATWENATDGLTVKTLFRGSAPGAKDGPYLSQFMLLGTLDLSEGQDENFNRTGGNPLDGKIEYGLQTINQAQLVPEEREDYMTTWEDWLNVQQGTRLPQPPHGTTRRIHTPRDLAGYVHFDALYQAYLNACLILLANGAQVDMGNPILQNRDRNSTGFATWGGPHILSLVTEVATRGLRAARRTKFQVHRRARPEVIAARIAQIASGHDDGFDEMARGKVTTMLTELGFDHNQGVAQPGTILDWVSQYNAAQNAPEDAAEERPATALTEATNILLPMAFVEGSPMHPAYGAGHATVAGACVTILKAFFEHDESFMAAVKGDGTFYAADDNDKLRPTANAPATDPTLADELDKLAANISIGRNMAGVHYYSDYYDSLRMGERIAVGILREQMYTYHEKLTMTLSSFDGDEIVLKTEGGSNQADVSVHVTDTNGYQVTFADWWTRDLEEYGIVIKPTELTS